MGAVGRKETQEEIMALLLEILSTTRVFLMGYDNRRRRATTSTNHEISAVTM